MLKRILGWFFLMVLIGLVLFLAIQIYAQSPTSVLRGLVKNNSLKNPVVNLKLNYLVIMPVGKAQLTNFGKERFRGEDLIHIGAQSQTLDYLNSIFHARATVDSYINPQDLDSRFFLQNLEVINKADEKKEISYDQKKHVMTYVGPRGTEERIIDSHAQDPLSAIYYIQNKKFEPGDRFSLGLNTNQKNYIISGELVKKEKIQISGENYDILLFESQVGRKDNNPRHQVKFRIWFLDYQGKRQPILIKAMTNIGPIVATAE
jgi:hypothetical protein